MNLLYKFFIIILFSGTISKCTQMKTIPPTKLVWEENFDVDGLPNPAHWDYDVGNACELPCGCGWGNNELQYYTRENTKNARIENGQLIIEAIKEKYENNQYTSARLVTRQKKDIRYGKIEVRAKLPSGRGTWPAIWLLPTENKYGGWPNSGEIDLMEHVGYNPDSIFGTVHTKAFNHMLGTQDGGKIFVPTAEKEFHVYAIEWYPDRIIWSVDNKPYHTFYKKKDRFAEWPFDQKFHLILNLAVGGNWGGAKGVDETIWPQQFIVDYIKVYDFAK